MGQAELSQKLAENDDLIHIVVKSVESKNHGKWFSVHVHAYLDRATAEAVRDKAEAAGHKSGVISLYVADNEGGGWGHWGRPENADP
jgi:hypothetical protein